MIFFPIACSFSELHKLYCNAAMYFYIVVTVLYAACFSVLWATISQLQGITIETYMHVFAFFHAMLFPAMNNTVLYVCGLVYLSI